MFTASILQTIPHPMVKQWPMGKHSIFQGYYQDAIPRILGDDELIKSNLGYNLKGTSDAKSNMWHDYKPGHNLNDIKKGFISCYFSMPPFEAEPQLMAGAKTGDKWFWQQRPMKAIGKNMRIHHKNQKLRTSLKIVIRKLETDHQRKTMKAT